MWRFNGQFKFNRWKGFSHQKSNSTAPLQFITRAVRCNKCVTKSLILFLFQTDFEWNDSERASVLGSFYWLHWALQLPGGLLARQFGAKRVFGFSNLFMFVMSLLMPVLARWDIKGLILARVLQGFVGVSATLFLFMFNMLWVSLTENLIYEYPFYDSDSDTIGAHTSVTSGA